MSNYKPLEEHVTGNPFATYTALDSADKPMIVKRFTVTYKGASFTMDLRSSVAGILPKLASLAEFRGSEGIAPWLRMEDKQHELYFVRPFYDNRLLDHLPPKPDSAPSSHLLATFRSLAHGFDLLKERFPHVNFFVYPDDLYVDGESAVVANWGLDPLRKLVADGWVSHWHLAGNSMDAASCYPQIETSYLAPRVLISPPIISPVFALAALYVYFRIGHGPFITESAPVNLNLYERIEFWKAHSTARDFLESGTVDLPALLHPDERRILAQALIPNSPIANCAELIDALSTRFG